MAKRTAAVEIPKARKARTPKAASQALPGLEKVRSSELDRACEVLAEIRQELAKVRDEETAEMFSALAIMRGEGVQAYTHAGIELVRSVGDEKLRVRLLKDSAEG